MLLDYNKKARENGQSLMKRSDIGLEAGSFSRSGYKYVEAQSSLAAAMNSVCQKLKVSPFRFMLLQQLDTLYDEGPFSTHGALALGSQSSCAINGRLLRKGLRYY